MKWGCRDASPHNRLCVCVSLFCLWGLVSLGGRESFDFLCNLSSLFSMGSLDRFACWGFMTCLFIFTFFFVSFLLSYASMGLVLMLFLALTLDLCSMTNTLTL